MNQWVILRRFFFYVFLEMTLLEKQPARRKSNGLVSL